MASWPSVNDLLGFALDQAETSARSDWLHERALLGAVLVTDAIYDVWPLLGPGDFFDPVHAMIWAACLRLRAEHRVESVAVSEAVRHVPAAVERIDELVRQFIPDDAHPTVLLRCAAEIRRAAAQRAA